MMISVLVSLRMYDMGGKNDRCVMNVISALKRPNKNIGNVSVSKEKSRRDYRSSHDGIDNARHVSLEPAHILPGAYRTITSVRERRSPATSTTQR